jgi:hypothetical protein
MEAEREEVNLMLEDDMTPTQAPEAPEIGHDVGAPIQVQLFTRIHEGMRVALAVPSAPVMNVHDTIFKIQRIRPNGTVILKKIKSLSEEKPR